MIWILNSEALEQTLEARKNKEFIQETLQLKGSKLENWCTGRYECFCRKYQYHPL